MPMRRYTLVHPDARLSQQNVDGMCRLHVRAN
jgi:hypothetical protein